LQDHFHAGTPVNDPPRNQETPVSELDDFLVLVQRYEHRLRSVVARLLDDPRDIDEAVQDTFVQAWCHRSEFRSEAAVFTWLYRIATNVALMRLRRRHHATVALDDLDPAQQAALSTDPLADHPDHLTRIAEVRAAIAELPEHYRIVVILRDVEGHSNAEVATLLGLAVTTVKAHLHRGRSALRCRLHP
jgi:RNA polymerase sigma-70 factor, ECF subfamily